MKKLGLLFCIIICSCKSITYQDVNPMIEPNKNLLPPLVSVVDISNLESTYSSGSSSGVANTFGSGYGANNFGGVMATSSINSTYYKDARVNDVINIFNKEIKENITYPYGEKKGYISLRLGYRGNDFSRLLSLPSVLSLGTINFLGFPADKISQSLEVEIEIWNNKKEVIRRYVENVSDYEYIAMYWGYSGNTVFRKVAADNIKQALEKIRIRIGNEAKEIKSKLK